MASLEHLSATGARATSQAETLQPAPGSQTRWSVEQWDVALVEERLNLLLVCLLVQIAHDAPANLAETVRSGTGGCGVTLNIYYLQLSCVNTTRL